MIINPLEAVCQDLVAKLDEAERRLDEALRQRDRAIQQRNEAEGRLRIIFSEHHTRAIAMDREHAHLRRCRKTLDAVTLVLAQLRDRER